MTSAAGMGDAEAVRKELLLLLDWKLHGLFARKAAAMAFTAEEAAMLMEWGPALLESLAQMARGEFSVLPGEDEED
jgi:hypothetical protein